MNKTQTAPQAIARPPLSPTVFERLLGALAALCLTSYCVWMQGAYLEWLLQPVPMAFVVSFVLGGLILSHGPQRIAQLLAVMFGRTIEDDAQREHLRSLCLRGRRLCHVGAVLQMVMRTAGLLAVLDSPSMIGPAIASILATLVFAVLLAELGFGAAEHWLTKRA